MDSSIENGHQDLEWAIKLNRISLEVLGLWPKVEEVPREKLKRNLHVLAILLLFVFGVLFPCIHSLIKTHEDIMIVIEHLQGILPIITCVVRIIVFWWKKEVCFSDILEDVIPIISMITEDWLKSRDVQEKKVMITWAQKSRIIVISSYIVMGVTSVCGVLLPIFGISPTHGVNINDTEKMFPLRVYYFYDVTKSPQYELTYISLSIGILFAAITYTGIDNFLGLLVFHICGQIDILSTRLIYLNKFVKFHNSLKNCVWNHTRLLRAIAVIEDTYNKMLLALFLYFGILFAFYGFLIINLVEERNYLSVTRILILICLVITILVHMALYCAVGEVLIIQCDRMYHAICSQKWYNLDSKKAKNLILLLIRTKVSCYITAGKVFPMTMSTFCNLVKTSAGYISVLLTTKNT
ncbi:uncharacterized protein LOC113561442 isoform X3 [Ooceraea biroi]|uniref:uncharacterized protein LOC113561442 isoform X3 n=1 Tax=Ooceraea biroi TaxID=2015173 RepID=UPI000F07BCAB|nr:uncharacterized protein LOC113561442 isoform X3 [Ooceraea biroi]